MDNTKYFKRPRLEADFDERNKSQIAAEKVLPTDDNSKEISRNKSESSASGIGLEKSLNLHNGTLGSSSAITNVMLSQEKGYYWMFGMLCKFCVLFSGETGGKGQHQGLNSLVHKTICSLERC